MMRRRKTKAEYEREFYEAKRRVWEIFRPQLESLYSYTEAHQLVDQAPPPDAPGRTYYSNLAFFLDSFSIPAGSDHIERKLYLQFIQRLDAAGELKPGARQKIEETLLQSINEHGFF